MTDAKIKQEDWDHAAEAARFLYLRLAQAIANAREAGKREASDLAAVLAHEAGVQEGIQRAALHCAWAGYSKAAKAIRALLVTKEGER